MTDYARYLPGITENVEAAMWCDTHDDEPIWTAGDDDIWTTRADEREQQHHAGPHDAAVARQIARGVVMFMNAEHPDSEGGAWTAVTLGPGEGDGAR